MAGRGRLLPSSSCVAFSNTACEPPKSAGCRRLISNQPAGKLPSVCATVPVLFRAGRLCNVHVISTVESCNSVVVKHTSRRAELRLREKAKKQTSQGLVAPDLQEACTLEGGQHWGSPARGGDGSRLRRWSGPPGGAAGEIDSVNDELGRVKRSFGEIRPPLGLHVVKRQYRCAFVLLTPSSFESSR